MFKPSDNQLDIFDFVKYGYGNAVISAVAGSGKTTTIIEALKHIKDDKRVLFLAFNKSIVEELKQKIQREKTDIRTTHSLGFSMIRNKYRDIDIKVNEDKYLEKITSTVKLNNKRYLRNIVNLCDYGRFFLIKGEKELKEIANKYGIVPIHDEFDVTLRLLEWSKISIEETGEIDYTDMIYLPNVLNLRAFKYDFVIVDEAQDLSISQMNLFKKCIKQGSRFIAVGDDNQCQPEGTKVLMSSGEYKNIEDVSIGDKVTSYDRHYKGQFIGYYKNHRWGPESMSKHGVNINETAKRKYDGNLIAIEANGLKSKYTPDHICLVRFTKESVDYHSLYLMEKNGMFRIGISPLWSAKGDMFGTMRAKCESADKFWILDVYETRFEAYMDEQYYSIEYSIPQMIFNHRQQVGNITQTSINEYYNRLDAFKLKSNANKILNLFGRDYKYPLWTHGGRNYFSKNHMFEINALNIIKDVMEVILFDDTKVTKTSCRSNKISATYHKIDKMEKEEYSGYVYSLSVNKHEVYVSDGILTHNCINAFAGSDVESFNKLKNESNTVNLPLTVSYRCPKNIVKFAQRYVPEIQYNENAEDGLIRMDVELSELKGGDMILCRYISPIVKLYIELLDDNVKCFIKGSEVGENLLSLIENTSSDEICGENGILFELDKFLLDYVNNNNDNDVKNTLNYNNLKDEIECIEILSRKLTSRDELTNKINEIFIKNEEEGIILSTIHKSKGLEADNVYILYDYLTPSRYAKLDWELKQEDNLKYVSYTRAKKILGFLNIK